MTAPSIDAVPKRVRLDQVLVQRGLAPSRERAQALILAGAVRVDGARADRAAAPVAEASEVAVDEGPRFVSRGGEKLAGALDAFALAVAGREAVGRGGIVRDPKDRAAAAVAVCEAFTAVGVGTVAIVPSRLPGREGNREIFVHCRKGDPGLTPGRIRERAAEAAE